MITLIMLLMLLIIYNIISIYKCFFAQSITSITNKPSSTNRIFYSDLISCYRKTVCHAYNSVRLNPSYDIATWYKRIPPKIARFPCFSHIDLLRLVITSFIRLRLKYSLLSFRIHFLGLNSSLFVHEVVWACYVWQSQSKRK